MAEKKNSFTLQDRVKKAQEIQTALIGTIQSVDLTTNDKTLLKANAATIFKMNAGVNTALHSGDRSIGFMVTSSRNMQDANSALNKLSGIMENMLSQAAYFTKRGETDKAIAVITEQANLQEELNKFITSLGEKAEKFFEKGYGRKDDVDEHKKKAHSTKMAKVNELAKLGKNPSEIAKEVEGIGLDEIQPICKPYLVEKAIGLFKEGKKPSMIGEAIELPTELISSSVGMYKKEFLSANKKEIEAAFIKESNIKTVAEMFEVKPKFMFTYLEELAANNSKVANALKIAEAPRNQSEKVAEPA